MRLDRESKQLVSTLQQGNARCRVAAYYGAAFSIVEYIKDTHGLAAVNEAKIHVDNLLYELAELAILDKPIIKKAIRNMLLFKVSILAKKNMFVPVATFEDSLGLSTYFNKDEIASINDNIGVYNDAVMNTASWLDKIVDEN